ncbi:MAG TPA: tail fiber domain-containing protein [Chthoniobacterales bacterium]|nr:tail fiber domain-containing protein [Chthoniobacterales bacterium]
MKQLSYLGVGAVLGLLCSTLHAQVPQTLNYQGRVVVSGVNFNGTGQFKFALFNGTNSSSTAQASVANISAGAIQDIAVNVPGNGYTSAPGVSITGDGSGASATAIVKFGHVTGITVSNGGSNYTAATVTVTPPPSNLNFTYWSNDGTSTNGSQPTNAVSIGVSNGLYSVLLGDTSMPNMTAVPNTIVYYSGADMRLRVWFNDGTHGFQLLSPDQPIASVVYAFGAGSAGNTSTDAVVFSDISPNTDRLVIHGPGGIKLKTAGHGSGVILTTDFSPSGGNQLNIDSDVTGANDATFSGNVYASSFTTTSDRNAKEKFRSVNTREILSRLTSLPIQTWNFKRDPSGMQHIGPMAQEFYAAFQVGPDDKHITTVDADGVAFAAIQGLNEIVQEQNAELAAKAKEIEALEKRVDRMEKTLKQNPPDEVRQ